MTVLLNIWRLKKVLVAIKLNPMKFEQVNDTRHSRGEDIGCLCQGTWAHAVKQDDARGFANAYHLHSYLHAWASAPVLRLTLYLSGHLTPAPRGSFTWAVISGLENGCLIGYSSTVSLKSLFTVYPDSLSLVISLQGINPLVRKNSIHDLLYLRCLLHYEIIGLALRVQVWK